MKKSASKKKNNKIKKYSKLFLLLILKVILVIVFVGISFLIGSILFTSVILVTIFALLVSTIFYLYLLGKIMKKMLLVL